MKRRSEYKAPINPLGVLAFVFGIGAVVSLVLLAVRLGGMIQRVIDARVP
jgi:hypothetical protein